MGTAHADEAAWNDAEARIRAEIRRLDDVVDDLRAGTAHLHWQGPGAGRFRWRTDRRVRELHDQRATLTLLLSLAGRAAADAHAQAVHAAHVQAANTQTANTQAACTQAARTQAKAHHEPKANRPC